MSDTGNTTRQPSYRYALLGGLIYTIPSAVNMFIVDHLSLTNLWQYLLPVFIGGTLLCVAGLFIFRVMPSRQHQNRLIVILIIIGIPLVLFGQVVGGLLGEFGILVFSSIPIVLLLLLSWFVLYRSEYPGKRLLVVLLIIALLVIAAVVLQAPE